MWLFLYFYFFKIQFHLKNYSPIGVFDSGYGGLTVLNELIKKLPENDFLYLGDNARAPYGSRSFEIVYSFTLDAVQELFSRGCKLVILACNTASAKALRNIQQKDLFDYPDHRVLGVIRPSTEIIEGLSKTKHVAVLATEGTVSSNSYLIEIEKFSEKMSVIQHACPMWVPLIENGEIESDGALYFIKKEIDHIFHLDNLVDTIILGCTHYPLIEAQIRKFVPNHVNIVSQGPIVADSLKEYLLRHPQMDTACSKNGQVDYLTTEQSDTFNTNVLKLTGDIITSTKIKL